MNPQLKYRAGYKYVTHADYVIDIPLQGYEVAHEYFTLDAAGRLWIRRGYAWDGASGLTIDTDSSIIGSLVHDVLFQMLREGRLPQTTFTPANEILRRLCVNDGMYGWRAEIWRKAVEKFGSVHAAVKPPEVLTAP
jgi:hypothetical protein